MSVYRQNYRPIELIIVDDGSTDGTLDIVQDLKNKLEDSQFTIKILHTDGRKGPAHARSLGLKHANGSFIMFMDADTVFLNNKAIDKFVDCFKDSRVVGYKLCILVDNWLEKNYAVDYGTAIGYAFHKSLIKNLRWDVELGAGEDIVFIENLRRLRILENVKILEEPLVGIHLIHSFREYVRQKLWYGRTFWLFVRKYPWSIYTLIWLIRMLPCAPLILSTLFLFAGLYDISKIMLALYILTVLYAYLIKKRITLGRLVYAFFNTSIGSLFYVTGMLQGLFQYLLCGKINTSRD